MWCGGDCSNFDGGGGGDRIIIINNNNNGMEHASDRIKKNLTERHLTRIKEIRNAQRFKRENLKGREQLGDAGVFYNISLRTTPIFKNNAV